MKITNFLKQSLENIRILLPIIFMISVIPFFFMYYQAKEKTFEKLYSINSKKITQLNGIKIVSNNTNKIIQITDTDTIVKVINFITDNTLKPNANFGNDKYEHDYKIILYVNNFEDYNFQVIKEYNNKYYNILFYNQIKFLFFSFNNNIRYRKIDSDAIMYKINKMFSEIE